MTAAKIASALVKAQKVFGPALKTSRNDHFRSKYADLAACIEAVIDGLNENGIALIQRVHPADTGVAVETVLVHESGETMECGILHVPASKQDPQGYGSALTYARRYSLMAACGIAPEDDDGNAASIPRQAPAAKDDGYAGFEAKHLPILREAAMQGQAALQEAFKSIPKSDHKLKMWTLHQKNLKAACEVAA